MSNAQFTVATYASAGDTDRNKKIQRVKVGQAAKQCPRYKEHQ